MHCFKNYLIINYCYSFRDLNNDYLKFSQKLCFFTFLNTLNNDKGRVINQQAKDYYTTVLDN